MRVSKPLLWIAVAAGVILLGTQWRVIFDWIRHHGIMPVIEEQLRRAS